MVLPTNHVPTKRSVVSGLTQSRYLSFRLRFRFLIIQITVFLAQYLQRQLERFSSASVMSQ